MEVLLALAEWPVAKLLRGNPTAYLLLNAAHILALGTLIGSIFALDLRLLGLFRTVPLPLFGPPLVKLAATGFGAALITGFLLFSVRPVGYIQNPAFLAKIALIALGLGNIALVHVRQPWRSAGQGPTQTAPGLKFAAAASMAIWTGTVVAGRWIGFL